VKDDPFFRFNPGAYQEGRAFVASRDSCDICRLPCVWRYRGNLYSAARPTSLCARCIAAGRVATFVPDRYFSFHDIELIDSDPDLSDELLRRTPGVACFNPYQWPVLDRTPMAFIGYGDDPALMNDVGARDAMVMAYEENGSVFEGSSSYLLVFKEIDGSRYRAVMDLD
jgi:uncharacterized protein CbrC (UPF0167 family)